MTSQERQGIGMVLYGEIIPSKGGDTQFSDQYAAYNSLPADLKKRIESLSIKHGRTHTSDGKLRQGFEEFAADDPRKTPGKLHPIVYTHPETGKKRFISVAGHGPMWIVCLCRTAKRYSMSFGLMPSMTNT